MKRQIVNIINFVRAIDPRYHQNMYTTFEGEIELMDQHHLRGTFLVQYDVLMDERFVARLKALDPQQYEIGLWHEIVKPQADAAGVRWTGADVWDHHVHCAYGPGYTREERETLADEAFRKFKEVFGCYPRVMGAWLLDSHTLRYVSAKYEIDAACICRDQYGTDGYTLWGGYYGQGYYPSRRNYFVPAQSLDEQINIPVFRMLGSDPVTQYDIGLDVDQGVQTQGVVTLEPAYCDVEIGGGGVKPWVDWYIQENFNGDCLSFGYTQAGQENNFGWRKIAPGLQYQFERFARLQQEGRLTVEPLGETGAWYKGTYPSTPASAICAHTSYGDDEVNSVWYSSKHYRMNVYSNHGEWKIRDLHLFSEKQPDSFEQVVCTGNDAAVETAPVVDGCRFSGNGIRSGLYITDSLGDAIPCGKMTFTDLQEQEQGAARLDYGSISVHLSSNGVAISAAEGFRLHHRIGQLGEYRPQLVRWAEHEATLAFSGVEYQIRLEKGSFIDPNTVLSENGMVKAIFVAL